MDFARSFREIILNLPVVRGNRVTFSWSSSEGFADSSYWIQYPDLPSIEASPGKLAEAYLPVCLGLAALGPVRLRLPCRIDEAVLGHWREAIRQAARHCFRNAPSFEIVNGESDPLYRPPRASRTALLLGGGTESLLVLARLREQGVSPLLVSLGGPSWAGSDPEKNPDKFRMDGKLARELGLDRLSVRTNFRELVRTEPWTPYLKPGLEMINAVLSLPWFVSLLLPVAEQAGIGRCVNGNEKMNFPDEYFCFSPGLTARLGGIALDFRYESFLDDLPKEGVCRELYRRYPQYAKYQYSCWRNDKRRWCHACESCFEYYMLLRANGLEASAVGMDESALLARLPQLVLSVARSGEGRPGEIWSRMCHWPELRRDPRLRRILNSIIAVCFLHRLYRRMPDGFQRAFRFLRSCIQRIFPSLHLQTVPA